MRRILLGGVSSLALWQAPDTPTTPPAPPSAEPTLATTPPAADPPVEPKPGDPPPAEPKPAEPPKPEPPPPIDLAKLTLPEGFKADDARLKSVYEVLSDEKLPPQDRMQKLVDIHATALKEASEGISKYWSDMQKEWGEANKAKYGPEPTKHPTIISIGKAIDSLGEKPAAAFREALDMSGMGNNPAIVAALGIWAEQLVETRRHAQGSPSGQRPSAADAIFGTPSTGQ